jgi:hypothetical protein
LFQTSLSFSLCFKPFYMSSNDATLQAKVECLDPKWGWGDVNWYFHGLDMV